MTQLVVIALGLIALYLALYYSGGTGNLLNGLTSFATNETQALQGRGNTTVGAVKTS